MISLSFPHSHVTLFSPWSLNTSPRGLNVLREASLPLPSEEDFPSGDEYRNTYLLPIADHLAALPNVSILYNTKCVSASKSQGILKGDMGAARRTPFRVLTETAEGVESVLCSDYLVDCSGSWGNNNPVGANGALAPGERRLRSQGLVETGLPSPSSLGALVSKSIAVVGSGASAITFISSLRQAALAAPNPTTVHWITRRSSSPLYTRVKDDPLPQRDALSVLANDLVEKGGDGEQFVLRHYGGTGIEALDSEVEGGMASITLAGSGQMIKVDKIISATG